MVQYLQFIEWIPVLLQQITSLDIEVLQFDYYPPFDHCATSDLVDATTPWIQVAELLQNARFASLRRVDITVFAANEPQVSSILQPLLQRGIFDFTMLENGDEEDA